MYKLMMHTRIGLKKTILSDESKARMLEIAKSEQVLVITNHIPWGG